MFKRFLLITIIACFPILTNASIPPFPMAFWGEAAINGVPAPVGSIVRVYKDAYQLDQITVQENGVYGYTEPTKQKLVLDEFVGQVTFTIQSPNINNGLEAEGLTVVSHNEFVSGQTINKNLMFTIVVDTGSSGQGSSGGGGGGGSKKKTPVSTVQKAPLVTAENVTPLVVEPIPVIELKAELERQLQSLLVQLLVLLQAKLAELQS